MTQADADFVLPHLPDVPVILLSSMDVYRAYELLLADEGGQPVPITEDADLRRGRYPLRGPMEGRDDYDKLHVEPAYLARGGTVLRLAVIYGERDPQRREEFILRRVRAGRKRIPGRRLDVALDPRLRSGRGERGGAGRTRRPCAGSPPVRCSTLASWPRTRCASTLGASCGRPNATPNW